MEILPGIRPKEWWEDFWKDPICGYGEPGKTLLDFASKFYNNLDRLKAVDIGSGDGRYAVALAKIGYKTDALELTVSGVGRILKRAKENNVSVDAKDGDFTKLWKIKKDYDIVLSAGLVEEVNPTKHKSIIQGYKNWTSINGHVLLKYCLEIAGRGQLIKRGLIPDLFMNEQWNIIFSTEETEMHPSRAKYTTVDGVDSAVMTGTLIAQRLS